MALIAAHLNAGHSGSDSVAIGIYSPSYSASIPHFPPFSPYQICLMVSVDVKHHVYLLDSNGLGFINAGVSNVGGYERNAWCNLNCLLQTYYQLLR